MIQIIRSRNKNYLMDYHSASGLIEKIRAEKPLIYHITNSVTINDCANITICAGASPIMSDCIDETCELTSAADALVLNIGTLSLKQVECMIAAGKCANDLKIPVIFDPVGAGASKMRTESSLRILNEVDVSVLRGNAGEIGTLAGVKAEVRGVDSVSVSGAPEDAVRQCSEKYGCVTVMSGAADYICGNGEIIGVFNGHPAMGRLCGTGCCATSLTAAFAAVLNNDCTTASAAAAAVFGICGEKAGAVSEGPYSFRDRLGDSLFRFTPDDFRKYADIRVL